MLWQNDELDFWNLYEQILKYIIRISDDNLELPHGCLALVIEIDHLSLNFLSMISHIRKMII